MVIHLLKVSSIICLWLATLVRLPHAIRHREQRALWSAVAMIAVVLTLYVKEVSEVLGAAAPAYVVYLGTHLATVVLGTIVLYLVLVTTGRRRFEPLLYIAAIVTVLLLAAFYLAAGSLRPTKALDLSLGYWLVLAGFGSTTVIVCMALCWYCGRRTDHWMLKLDLFILGTGFALLAAPWLLTIAESITHNKSWDSSISNIDGVAAACIAIGAILPVVSTISAGYRALCAYKKLGKLWRALTNTAPNVVFTHHSQVRQLMAVPGQLALYRRIIEIRDAITILRNYTTPEVVQAAQQHVAEAAVPVDHGNAAITACWLAAAQDRQATGYPAQAQTLAAVASAETSSRRKLNFSSRSPSPTRIPPPRVSCTTYRSNLPRSGSNPMKFIQLIDYQTTRVDEVQALLTSWIATTGGVRTATRTTVGRDRNDPTHFIAILQFPAYDEAMRNSDLPPTKKIHEEFVKLCVEEPKFIDLDVIRDEGI